MSHFKPIRVVHGVYDQEFDAVGRTVEEVFDMVVATWRVPTDAMFLVNGREIEHAYVLQEGDQLEFVKFSGTKGCEGPECPCTRSNNGR